METCEVTIIPPWEERPMSHVLLKLLGSCQCRSVLLPREVPDPQAPSHGGAPGTLRTEAASAWDTAPSHPGPQWK